MVVVRVIRAMGVLFDSRMGLAIRVERSPAGPSAASTNSEMKSDDILTRSSKIL